MVWHVKHLCKMKLQIRNKQESEFNWTFDYKLLTIGLGTKINSELWCNYISVLKR